MSEFESNEISREEEILSKKTATLNVRISPVLKAFLVEKAGAMQISITEFIEHILTDLARGSVKENQTFRKLKEIEDKLRESENKCTSLSNENKQLQESLNFYEKNQTIQNFFSQYEGKEVRVGKKTVLINDVKDVFTVLLLTVKSS